MLLRIPDEFVEQVERWRSLSKDRAQRVINGCGDMAITKPFGWGIETNAKHPGPIVAEAVLAAVLHATKEDG